MTDQSPSVPSSSVLLATQIDDEADGDMRAAIYARTSSVNQRFGYSLDEQVRQCWERCEMLGWNITHIFKDEAESGDDTERPHFQRMMAAARSQSVDVIVFWKLDRFSRSILHAVELERELRQDGIALHSVTEQLDTSTPSGRFNFRNIASAAEFEREHIKQRSQMGFKALALKHGWPNDTPPFGYERKDDASLSINEDEAETVRYIFEQYCDLQSMPEVAANLNDLGLLTRDSNEWSARTVNKLLRNQIYCGHYSIAGVEEEVPEYRIVSQRLFDEVSEVRHRFQNGNRSRDKTMPESRKSRYINRVVDSYREFLGDCS